MRLDNEREVADIVNLQKESIRTRQFSVSDEYSTSGNAVIPIGNPSATIVIIVTTTFDTDPVDYRQMMTAKSKSIDSMLPQSISYNSVLYGILPGLRIDQ
jgi:hypothetical protein